MHARSHNLALAALLVPAMAMAQTDPPLYHVTDMAAPLEAMFDYEFLSSQSRAVNENGDLIGEVAVEGGLQHSFIFTFEHGLVILPLLDGAPATQAMDLTDRDANGDIIIVGGSVHGVHDYAIDAAVWRFSTVTGEVIETRKVGNLPDHDEGKLVAVNNNGVAIGYQGQDVHQLVTKYDIATGVLEPLSFPVRATAINNADQIIGGRYQGDLFGGFFELGLPPDCISLTLTGIADDGSLAGRAGRPYSDGAGRTLASWVRLSSAGWLVPDPGSPWDTGFAINNNGDFTIGYGRGWDGGIYLDGLADEFAINTLLPEMIRFRYSTDVPYGINDNLQIAASSRHAVLLTPIGTMIIPGDVNGDVAVNHDDHCAWTANPIDLDGDGRVGPEDEQWLIARLAVFGYEYRDCDGNGTNDHCDITAGVSNDCNGNGIPDECEPDCDGDGIPDSCESDCNGNGIPDDCDIRSGFSEDCNGNGIPDECDDSNTVEGRLDYDPPLWLYDDVYFVDSITITEAGTIADVDFTIHSDFRIGQTAVRLSHAGVTVTLIDQPGHPASRDGFVNLGYDAILDDEGTGPSIETVGETCCSFGPIVSPPSYRPHEPLSAFDGLPREGVWTVEFIGGFAQAADPRLHSWSVLVTDEPADPGECCPADFDGDGELTIFDFLAFQNAFDAGDPTADFDGDGELTIFDFLAFQNAFQDGCA